MAASTGLYAAAWLLVEHASANTAGDLMLWLLSEVAFSAVALLVGQQAHRRVDVEDERRR